MEILSPARVRSSCFPVLVCLSMAGCVAPVHVFAQETASNAAPADMAPANSAAANATAANSTADAAPANAPPGAVSADAAPGATTDAGTATVSRTDTPAVNGGYPMTGTATAAAPSMHAYADSRISNCGDALSDALGQTNTGMPCWSDIRTVDHWNTLTLERSMTINGNAALTIPGSGYRGFSYTLASLNGLLYLNPGDAQAFAGVGAFSGYVRMRKWQMTFEDGGAAAGVRLNGDSFAGLNRGAIRVAGSAAARWSWQAGLTNSYGSDLLRTAAPIDYRKIGEAEAPVTDVVAYGIHAGNVVDEQEDARFDFQQTRRTSYGLSLGHTLRNYQDDDATIQTERVRAEALHSLSDNAALGFQAGASRQTGPAPCSLAGLGAVGLLQWGRHASISASGSLDGASDECGKRVQGTGDVAVFLRAAPRTDFFVSGDRDLSGGVVQSAIFMNSASAGIHQGFRSGASLRFSGAAVHFNDVLTNAAHTGAFAEADAVLPIGRTLLYETTYRHFQVSSLPVTDNRNLVTFTLWFSPKRTPTEILTAHR